MAGLGLEAAVMNILIGPKLTDTFGSTLGAQLDEAVGPAAEKVSKSFSEKLSAGLGNAGKKASIALTAPLVAVATKGVFDAQKISAGLAEVVSLTGQTGEVALNSIKDLSGEVANLSSNLGIAQETLVAGLYSAISAGVPRDNVFEFLEVAGKAAIAGVTDTNTAVDGLTTVINAFGLSAGDVSEVADSLFTAVKGGKTTFQELSDSLFNVAPAAAAAGVDFQTVNAAIATLTAAGVPTSVATTQIRAALIGLQKPSKEIDAIFQDLGFETRAAAIESLGLQGALGAVRDAAKGDQGALQTLLGSVEAVGATNILAGTSAEKFTAELKAQADAAGATNDAFELIDQTRDFERLKVDLQNLSVTIGNVLLPFVKQIASLASDLAKRFENLSPRTQDLIVKIGAFAAAIGPVLLITSKLIVAVKVIVGVFKLLNLTLLASPWVLIAVAAIAAVVLIVKNWDTIVAFFRGLWNIIKSGFTALWSGLVAAVRGYIAQYVAIIRGIINVVVIVARAISSGFATAFNSVRTAVQSAYNFIVGIINKIKGLIDSVVNAIKNLPATIASGLDSLTGGVLGKVTSLFRAEGGPVSGGRPYIVGEVGPELFVPRTSGAVVSNANLASMLGNSGSGPSYNITINNPMSEQSSTSIPNALRKANYLRS